MADEVTGEVIDGAQPSKEASGRGSYYWRCPVLGLFVGIVKNKIKYGLKSNLNSPFRGSRRQIVKKMR